MKKVPAADSLQPAELEAMARAEYMFFDALRAAPARDGNDPVYADWWAASRMRSEEYLRTALGWDRFNRLSIAAARLEAESLKQTAAGISLHDEAD